MFFALLYKKKAELLHQKEIDLERSREIIQILESKYSSIIDKDFVIEQKQIEIEAIGNRIADINKHYVAALNIHKELESEVNLYQSNLEISAFGLYAPQFNFETSEKYKAQIDANYEKQKAVIKEDNAVICHTVWEVGGSKVEGRKMTNQYKKLMLFAFNGECDALIAKVKWNNATKSKERMLKSFENINKLGVTQQIEITNQFLKLKLDELSLTYEYEQKKYDEKEEQRVIREQMRDEEKAQKEFEKAQREAEDEEKRFQKALDKANLELASSTGTNISALQEQVKLLESKLADAQNRKERAIALAQLTRVGHIYIISNVGSFGEDVYKIGMTRRLDPLDRVKELGDASVPFHFDIHAIIYSENAPSLENELHKKFHDRRLNKVNGKKEFFRVSLDEIAAVVNKHKDAEIEFTMLAEAREYRETLKMLEQLKAFLEIPEPGRKFPSTLV